MCTTGDVLDPFNVKTRQQHLEYFMNQTVFTFASQILLNH